MLSADLPPLDNEEAGGHAADGLAQPADQRDPSGSFGEDFQDRQPEMPDTPELSSQLLELAEADEEAEVIGSDDEAEPDLISIGTGNAIWGVIAERGVSPTKRMALAASPVVVDVEPLATSETQLKDVPVEVAQPGAHEGGPQASEGQDAGRTSEIAVSQQDSGLRLPCFGVAFVESFGL